MPAAHDRGGWPDETPIDRTEHEYSDWERRVDAVHQVLGARGVRTTDEMRRAIESLAPGDLRVAVLLRKMDRRAGNSADREGNPDD